MLRKLINRFNPTRQLPQAMRRYLALPGYLWLGWVVASGLILFVGAQVEATAPDAAPPASSASPPVADDGGQPSADAPAAELLPAVPADGATIGVSGSSAFSIRRSGGRWLVDAAGAPPLELAGGGEEWRMLDRDGATVYRLKTRTAEEGKLYDAAGVFRWRVKCGAEEGEEACKLYDAAGDKQLRVKIKADGFNVYGAGDRRIYQGKLKSGRYQVRDETGAAALDIEGAASLKAAALLALPLEVPVRVLLWAHSP
ncbi:hypothetical protein [Methylogaea oryzae]|uniref:Uncharacterized protein n=2 Tax=Methylogaea oryzae TaxID=1295382 RepID=A0A8D4VRP9_9GAMM|nr:hypothetical protein [Methylogaea oryzae]BBL72621.1 hypothetical protein MoryE10_32270 [Methylogaea oryzae]